jgi:xeroderma pigmentosum group C-complementing protein
MSLERLDRLIKAHVTDSHDANRFGEQIMTLDEFRGAAMKCEGSRDVGAQLFTALLRGLGMEARLVANLQPLGFGWNKSEEADEERDPKLPSALNTKIVANHVEEPIPKAVEVNGKTHGRKVSQSKAKVNGRGKARMPESDEESEEPQLLVEDSDDDSVIEILPPTPKKTPRKVYDKELEFPHYWTEVLSPVTKKYVVVDAVVKGVVGTNRDLIESLEPRGGKADKAKQVMAYVVGYSPDGTAKDVTVRYLKKQLWPGRTKGARMPVEKVPIYNRHGKVKRHDMFDWFRSAMAGYARGGKKHPVTELDEQENATDLKPAKPEKKEVKEGEETLQYYKQSKELVLERHLKREEALLPSAKAVKMFSNKGKGGEMTDEPVFSRSDVVQVKSAETWHKQGRAPLEGEAPLKRVPYRAATTNRRRELAAAEAATGEKVLQGLYSFNQTDWIIPPPIENGVIPKNDYGNIDLFAEHMCPEGAVHVPFRSAVRVCKKLEIDFAEAVVGFEFGHRMAIPVISGVVIAEENHDLVMEEVAKEEAERARKEDEKKRKEVLSVWRKFLMGMRIVERIKTDYGEMKDEVGENVFGSHHRHHGMEEQRDVKDEDMAGGFLPDGFEYEGHDEAPTTSGFFPTIEEGEHDDESSHEDGDTLMVEHGEASSVATPVSVEVLPKTAAKRKAGSKAKAKPKPAKKALVSRKRGRRTAATPSEDEDDDDDLSDPPSDWADGDFQR